ncbi:hypothetical protein FRC02_007262 [Tulasnella sp. 418]|nr:hypothetical protein FRC02_007262 [Tulasnella sp. 418]
MEHPSEHNCPINRLSFDIFHEIFQQARLAKVTMYQIRSCDMSVAISHVCRQWRDYSLNIPTIWNQINFKRLGGSTDWERQLVYLERARNAPLDILIWSGEDRRTLLSVSKLAGILRILKPHLHRWRTLDVYVHFKGLRILDEQLRQASAPALEKLTIDVWVPCDYLPIWRLRLFSGGLPSLNYLKMPLSLPLDSSKRLQMDSIRKLYLSDFKWFFGQFPATEAILLLLSKFPNIEEVTMGLSFRLQPVYSPLSMTIPVQLPHLTSLKFLWGDALPEPLGVTLPIFDFIHAPRLRGINAPDIDNSIIHALGSSNPFPGLQRLRLSYFSSPNYPDLDTFPPSVLNAAFSNLSALTDLSFSNQNVPTILFCILQDHCPHLINLDFHYCGFSAEECRGLVLGRLTSKILSPFHRLEIQMSSLSKEDQLWLRSHVPEFIYGDVMDYLIMQRHIGDIIE